MRKIYAAAILPIAFALALSCASAGEAPPAAKSPAPKQESPEVSSQAEWNKTVAEAKQEGKVTLYTSMGMEMRTVLAPALKDSYGIELEMVSAPTGQIVAKIISEARAGLHLADVYMGGSSSQLQLKESASLQPVEPFLVLSEVLDKNAWLDGDLSFMDKARLILIFDSHANMPIVINKDMAIPAVKSAKELLDPKWKGKILMHDPSISGAGNVVIVAMGELHGEDFIRQLAAQEPTIVGDYRTLIEWVARGKYPIGIGTNPETVHEFVKAGAPIAMPALSDLAYTSSAQGIVSIPAQLAHPNVAKVFVNWLLSREGQTAYMRGVGTQVRRLDVTTEYLSPETIRQPGVRYLNTETEEIVAKKSYYQKISKEIFGKFLK